jgi:hypothetical protein
MGRKCDGIYGFPVNCGMLPLGVASSLWASIARASNVLVDSVWRLTSVPQKDFSGKLPAWTEHMKPHQLSDNNEPYD